MTGSSNQTTGRLLLQADLDLQTRGFLGHLLEEVEEIVREDTTAHSFEQELDDAYERLGERTETVIDQVEFDIEDGTEKVRSHASDILIRQRTGIHDGPDDAYEKGLLALAVRRKVEHHAYALIPTSRDPQ